MHLPPEVIGHIVSYFLTSTRKYGYPADYETERHFDWDALINCRKPRLCSVDGVKDKGITTTLYSLVVDITSLLRLRLVSRAWHAAATHVLRDHHTWALKLDDLESLAKALLVFRQGAKKPSSLPWPVAKVEMPQRNDLTWTPFVRHYTYDPEPDEEEDLEKRRTMYDDVLLPETSEFHRDRCTAYGLLRHMFDGGPPIETFSLRLPEGPGYWHRNGNAVHCYDMQGLDELASTIRHGLGSPCFSRLVDMRLELPSPWYVGQLASAMDQAARDRMRHFYLRIVDDTGCAGTIESLPGGGADDPDINDGYVEDYCYTKSNVQWEYPNREFQGALWELVASCPNLESLGVVDTHYLDLDRLAWEAPNSRGLRVLVLERVWASIPSIVKLLRPGSPTCGPRIRRICLDDVKIRPDGGNWADLFRFLDGCPDLELNHVCNLTYFTAHANYDVHHGRLVGDSSDLWTADEDERVLMGRLCRKLVRRAGGKEAYPMDSIACDLQDSSFDTDDEVE